MADPQASEPAWWKDAFTADYLRIYAHRDDAEAEAMVERLMPMLAGIPGPVLDVGCGGGRHLAALRRRGVPAFGLDFSSDLLVAAKARPELPGRLVRADMRAPPIAPGSCGAVLLLFTAFGYFSDEENAACLKSLAELLLPGGVLILDLPDPEAVKAGLVAESQRMVDGRMVWESRRIVGNRVEKTVRMEDGREWRESVRMFYPDEIQIMVSSSCISMTTTALSHQRSPLYYFNRPN